MSEENTNLPYEDLLADIYNKRVEPGRDLSGAHIGNFNMGMFESVTHVDKEADMRSEWRDDLYVEDRNLQAKTLNDYQNEMEAKYGSGLAYCNGSSLVLPKYNISDELKNELSPIKKDTSEYVLGNTIAEISVMGHERTHYLHYLQHDGSGYTPYMAAACSDITEQIAYHNQYMTIASIWKNAKQAGVETLDINGRSVKVDDILDYMPGLKEALTDKKGRLDTDLFDVNSPECCERMAQVSSKYWNEERSELYVEQAQKHALECENFGLGVAIVNAREWEDRKQMMVTNLMTGDGHPYDASNCLKYFEPSEERIAQNIQGLNNVSNEGLKKVGQYLDSIGVKTDEEIEKYTTEQLVYIAKRDPKADKQFKEVLLEVSDPSKKQVVYADGLIEKRGEDGEKLLSADGGKSFYGLPENEDKALLKDEIAQQKGKYPPDAPNVEIEASRSLNGLKADTHINKAEKLKQAEQTKENQENEAQQNRTTQTNVNAVAMNTMRDGR